MLMRCDSRRRGFWVFTVGADVLDARGQRGQDDGRGRVDGAGLPRTAAQRLGGPAVSPAPPIVLRAFLVIRARQNPLQSIAAFDDPPGPVWLSHQSDVVVGAFHLAHAATPQLVVPGPTEQAANR